MIALLVPEISPGVGFCDGRTGRGIEYSISWIIHESPFELRLLLKVIRTLEPVDGEPLVLALVAPNYPFNQCRWEIDANY